MFASTPHRQGSSIVILGTFNPAIFHPQWFATQELVPQSEADAAVKPESGEPFVQTRDIAVCQLGMMQVAVEQPKLSISTPEQHAFPLLRDLALGILANLEHTPLTALGFNFDCVYQCDSKTNWHAFGDQIAPKTHWEKMFTEPKLLGIRMQAKPEKVQADYLQIRVAGNTDVEWGVFVSVNQHYTLTDAKFPSAAQRHIEALRILTDDYLPFIAEAQRAVARLLGITHAEDH